MFTCPNFTVTFGFLNHLIKLWVVNSCQLSQNPSKTAERDKWWIFPPPLSCVPYPSLKYVINHDKKKKLAEAEVSRDATITHVNSPEYHPSSPTRRLGPPSFTNDSQTGSSAHMRD